MAIFKKNKPVPTQDDSTEAEKKKQAEKFKNASKTFGKVGQKDKTWKK